MKFNTLCVATLSAVVAGGVLASSPYDVQTPVGLLVNESLDGFGYSRRNPAVGEIWELASPSMRVFQVVDGGVLVERGAFPTPDAKRFFVKTSRVYADGDTLATGYYRAEGTISYKNVLGAQRTVYAFSELSTSHQQEIRAFRQDKAATAAAQRQAEVERRQRAEQTIEFKKSKERIAAEEAAEKARLERERVERENAHELAKLNAEKDNRVAAMKAEAEAEANRQKAANAREMARLAREREEQDKENRKRIAAAKAEKRQADAKLAAEVQKERERYAADILSALDFNFKHHYVVQRSIRKNVRLEMVDPLWGKLVALQSKKDWLGMLGEMEDDEYENFPTEKEIDAAITRLKKRLFNVQIKAMRPPHFVSVWSGHIKDRNYDRNGGWGKIDIFCNDPTMHRLKSLDDAKAEDLQIAIFGSKFYVCDSDEGYGSATKPMLIRSLKAGEEFDSPFEDMATETEEWLKSN